MRADSREWLDMQARGHTIFDWRTVAHLLQRESILFFGASASGLHLFVCLLIYGSAVHTGTGLVILVLAIFLAMLGAEIAFFDIYGDRGRPLVKLPIQRSALARTHWFLGVVVPTLWICGLTVLVTPFVASGSRFTWSSIVFTCAAAFAFAGIAYCLTAFRLGSARMPWGNAARFPVPYWVALTLITLFGGAYFLVPRVDSGQWTPVLWLLAVAVFASALGFARVHALLTADKAPKRSRIAGFSSIPGRRRIILQRLNGFSSIATTSLSMPVLLAAGATAGLLLARGLAQLFEFETTKPQLALEGGAGSVLVPGFFVLYGFAFTIGKFAVPRVFLTLPITPMELSVRLTLLPVALVLIQLVLAVIGIHLAGGSAEISLLLALLGGTGIGSLGIPASLAATSRLSAMAFAQLGSLATLLLWFLAAPYIAALHVVAPLIFVAVSLLSIFLSKQVLTRSSWHSTNSSPLYPFREGMRA